MSIAGKPVKINTQAQHNTAFNKPNGEIKGDKVGRSQGDLSRPGDSKELPSAIPCGVAGRREARGMRRLGIGDTGRV